MKALGYYINHLLPQGKSGTFKGEVWNGIAKGVSCFASTLAVLIPLSGMLYPHRD